MPVFNNKQIELLFQEINYLSFTLNNDGLEGAKTTDNQQVRPDGTVLYNGVTAYFARSVYYEYGLAPIKDYNGSKVNTQI